MKTKIKYAESSALKWQSEDFDRIVEGMFGGDEISSKDADKLVSIDNSEKLKIIENAIETASQNLMETIWESIEEEIRNEITKNNQDNGN